MIDEVIEAIKQSWCKETSYNSDLWTEDNPALGQCVVSCLVLQDYLSDFAEIGKCKAVLPDGTRQSNYVLLRGLGHLDISGEQYPVGTKFVKGDYGANTEYLTDYALCSKKSLLKVKDVRDRYKILADKVKEYLEK